MRTGFTSTLNWYRTSQQNWQDEAGVPMMVPHPALIVLAGRDRVLRPSLADGMEAYVPNLKRAVRTIAFLDMDVGCFSANGANRGAMRVYLGLAANRGRGTLGEQRAAR